jgi:hypothetical protein
MWRSVRPNSVGNIWVGARDWVSRMQWRDYAVRRVGVLRSLGTLGGVTGQREQDRAVLSTVIEM